MPPKKKPVAAGASGSKRRMNRESSSSESGESMDDSDYQLAMDIAQRRTTRQSARTCMLKIRGDSLVDEEMEAQEDQKPKDVSYDYQELLNDPAYNKPELYKSMEPEEFNMDYYHRTGLTEVLKFSCPPEKLGMKMVDDDFTVDDVEKLVGGDRMITVVVVATQQSEDMPLKKFIEFYKNVDGRQSNSKDDTKRTLYNVLSLEFSNTALTDLVQSPSLVREIDWASSWPDERKMRSISFEDDGTFNIHNRYPRVENYCLMSPNECYTDFHIDFHGTSVWYHVKKGKKVFWIIEPTEQNLKMYEEYMKNTESSAFFGTIVETCARVEVLPGNTLIIPSGWIHAVYTPVDSLVFGGNFLHSRSALMQLNVLQGENRIGINKKYRYPYSEEAVFFYLNKVVKEVTGRQHIRPMSRNQQNHYYEYVGEQFREKNMHHRVPLKADYDDDGVTWKQRWEETAEYIESKAKLAKWDGNGMEEMEKDEENDVKKVDGDYDGMPILSPKKEVNDGMPVLSPMKEVNEDEKTIDVKVEEKDMPEFGGHDDMFIDDLTFYHPVSFNLDAGRGATAVHTLPLSTVEPRIKISKVTLKKAIHQLEVVQWEGLIVNLLKKSKVDVPDGLTRPNSLIQTFCKLLKWRRKIVEEEEGIKLGRCVLPDKEGSRRLHEEQKRAAAERKRKNEEKKMKIEDGDGEEDIDWTEDCEQPKKKKTRKSEEVGKMGRWMTMTDVSTRDYRPPKEKDYKVKWEEDAVRFHTAARRKLYWKNETGGLFLFRSNKIDAKRYKLEVKHDHLLDDDDHDDTHRDEIDVVDGGITHSMITRGGEMMEGINVHTGGDGPSHPITSTSASNDHSSPLNIQSRSSSFSRRPIQTMQQTPSLILYASSPIARRISRISTDGWGGMNGERRDRQSSGRSPTRKPSSQFSSSDIPPLSLTPSHTPHTPVTPTTSSTPIHSTTLSTSKQTRLSQAEQFTMAAPKVIDAPRLATPLVPTQSSNSDLSVLSQSNSISGIDPLPSDIWCGQMERFTAEIERANAIMDSTSANGN